MLMKKCFFLWAQKTSSTQISLIVLSVKMFLRFAFEWGLFRPSFVLVGFKRVLFTAAPILIMYENKDLNINLFSEKQV